MYSSLICTNKDIIIDPSRMLHVYILFAMFNCYFKLCLKVPTLRHDFKLSDWQAIGHVLAFGWMKHPIFSIRLSPSFLNACLYGFDFTQGSQILDDYMLFVSISEMELMKQALDDFDSVDQDDLLDFLK